MSALWRYKSLLFVGAAGCALVAAVMRPTSAWIIAERVFRLLISLSYLGHHHW